MGRKRHSDEIVAKGKNCAEELHRDDTRYGIGQSHRGLPPKKSEKSGNWQQRVFEGVNEYYDRRGRGATE